MYFVVNYLYGTIEKIDGSKDRYLVIDKNSLMNEKNIDFFYYIWESIINKIKYLTGDDVMFDDNEVIIKDWNKVRFSSDIFIPNDVFINFHSLVIVIMSLKKMMNLFQKFILMKDILKKFRIK